ncbi:MAG: DegT/DnrJ/EryC1/StrS family aminotransferase [Candidatus Omnitrophota bacterium]|jgi:dTDP-4-amino-4,6-dideoxygalactose transaminase
MSQLALFGGTPVRKKPFMSPVIIDGDERRYVNKVLKDKELSRFMGSPSKDIKSLLVMGSVEAEKHEGQYFSFLGGKMVRKFEAAFARRFKVPFAISVNSATSGLVSALGACGMGPGDEVITTGMSFNATALSILGMNSIPVFVDVDPNTFCLDPEKIKRALTSKTKAILVVHLLGRAADMDSIMRIAKARRLKVIEDCAQAPGTKYKGKYVGTIGDLGVFSFQETKNITTGEGGMVVTKDPAMAKRVRLIRNHGESIPDASWGKDDLVNIVGMNYRMTELTAAVGVAQLKKLDKNNRIRTENASFLIKSLEHFQGIRVPRHEKGVVPHVLAMCYDAHATGVERSNILAALRAEGIPVGSGYLKTMYENPIFLKKVAYGLNNCPWSCHSYRRKIQYKQGDCPVAEELLSESFIWFYHINRPNTRHDMEDVVKAFKKVYDNLYALRNYKSNSEVRYKW